MITIGERQPVGPQGDWCEVETLEDGVVVARIMSSAVESYHVTQSSGKVDGGRLILKRKNEEPAIPLAQGSTIRVLVGQAGGPEHEILHGTVDYVEIRRDAVDEPFVIQVQGRGRGARLMDNGYRGSAQGTLDEVVACLTEQESVVTTSAPFIGDIRLWADAGSTFGLLQLLAISTGTLLERRQSGGFDLTTRELVVAARAGEIPRTIPAEDVLKVRKRQGTPVRGIKDDPESQKE